MEIKPEPLKGNIGRYIGKYEYLRKDKVKSAVEWYRLYKDNKEDLLKDFPDIYEEYEHYCLTSHIYLMKRYNDWLLDKAFEDAMKDGGNDDGRKGL